MNNKKRKYFRRALVVFILYLLVLFYLLFFSETYGRTMDNGYRYNMELFKEISRFWNKRETLGMPIVILNLAGNVLAFMPFGFFVPILWRFGRNVFVCVLLTCLFSWIVETIQLFAKVGAFDVDDIFLNTIGGLLGFLVYRFWWRPLVQKKNRRNGENK